MRVATLEGVLSTASENLAAPFVALFSLWLGASATQIGLITALPALLANVLQVPMALVAERWRRRKILCVAGIAAQRLPWLVVACIPFLFSGKSAILALIVVLAIRAGLGSAATPAWTSLMADLTPKRLRGSYFANRNILCNLAALAASVAAAAVFSFTGESGGYPIVFALAGVLGLLGAYSFVQFPDLDSQPRRAKQATRGESSARGTPVSRPQGALAAYLHQFTRERSFAVFTATSFLFGLGVTLPQPLFSVYFVDQLGGTATAWGVVTGTTIVTTIVGQRYWGPLADRLGGKRIMTVSGVFAGLIPVWWFLASRPEHAYLVNLAGGFFWAGYNLAAFNLLLEVTPDEHRTSFVAWYNGIVGVSHFFGPLLGGIAADMTSIRTVLLASAVLRLLGWASFVAGVKMGPNAPLRLSDFIRPGGRTRRRRIAHPVLRRTSAGAGR